MEEKRRKAVIGLGANLGEREETIRRALEAVNALPFRSERTLTEGRGYDLGRCRDQEAEALERLVDAMREK